MKLFISWSGPLSQQVADVLRQWIPTVLQSVDPFMSASDVDKGARWTVNITQELADSEFGVICVTPDNLGSPWLNFEAGAISKSLDRGHVSPFLFHVDPSAIIGPLEQFQHTVYKRPDVFKLLKSVNGACTKPISDTTLQNVFDPLWPQLQANLDAILPPLQNGSARTTQEMLTELIVLVRNLQKVEPAPRASQKQGEINPVQDLSKHVSAYPKFTKILVSDAQRSQFSYLLARIQVTTNKLTRSPKFNNPDVVQLRALATLLVKELAQMVDGKLYDSYLRMAEEEVLDISQENRTV